MSQTYKIDWGLCDTLAISAAFEIATLMKEGKMQMIHIFPVPRGGIYAALAVLSRLNEMNSSKKHILVDKIEQADIVIDDLRDSGATQNRLDPTYSKPWFFLIDKERAGLMGKWVIFPWEAMCSETSPTDAVVRLLQHIGEDPSRDGLKDTPARVTKALSEMTNGYHVDIKGLFTMFEDTSDEMVISKNIPFHSLCEHHMLPFHGVATIAYLPGERIVGISKLTRVLNAFAHRLQVQERLTSQITETLDKYLEPLGSACVIRAHHMCMSCRGVRNNSEMITSSLTGVFKSRHEVRAEFMSLVNS